MKNGLITLLIILGAFQGIAQVEGDDFTGRLYPVVKKSKLMQAMFIGDISADIWRNLVIPYEDRIDLERQELAAGNCQDYHYFPWKSNDSKITYYVIEYAAVRISAVCNGKTLTAECTGDKLSTEQKNILLAADLNTEISLRISYRLKGKAAANADIAAVKEGELAVMVIPETEAEFPGGNMLVRKHLVETVTDKLPVIGTRNYLQQATLVFTVDSKGHVTDAKIIRSSSDAYTDQMLIDAAMKMPKWKPAENDKREKVQQVISLRMGDGC